MNQALKKAWTSALRSGAYRQCRGTLALNGGYCCLGVLASVAGLTITSGGNEVEYDGYKPLETLAGQPLEPFWARNDGDDLGEIKIPKHTFAQIADYIDEVL